MNGNGLQTIQEVDSATDINSALPTVIPSTDLRKVTGIEGITAEVNGYRLDLMQEEIRAMHLKALQKALNGLYRGAAERVYGKRR